MILDIIIVNWNAGKLLLNCVKSVLDSDINEDLYNIHIVDNNSSDDSLKYVENLSGRIHIIRSEKNLGFGSACNLVLKNISTKFVLLLNPDVILETDSLRKTLVFISDNINIDVVGVKILNKNGHVAKSCARFPTSTRIIYDILGLSKVAPKIFIPGTIMEDWDHLNSREVDHVIGAYMMIRFEAIKKIDFFDQDFFLYMEDVDLSYRLKESGSTIYYNSDITIMHEGGGTTKKVRSTSLYYSLISRIIYCRKHLKRVPTVIIIFLSSTIEPLIRLIKICLTLNFIDIRHNITAYSKYYRWLITNNR